VTESTIVIEVVGAEVSEVGESVVDVDVVGVEVVPTSQDARRITRRATTPLLI
jgi:hypothetical protein